VAIAGQQPPPLETLATADVVQRVLAQALPLLIEAYAPEAVYLFGSVARGEQTADSDIDVLLVVSDAATAEQRQPQLGQGTLRAHGVRLPLELHIWRQTPFEFRFDNPASFPSTVVREGLLLFRQGGLPVESSREGDTRRWLEIARADLASAEWLLQAKLPFLDEALFHCQQAAEKALKAVLTYHRQPFRRTHELQELGDAVQTFEAALSEPIQRVVYLSQYAWRQRYPHDEEPEIDIRTTREALALVKALLEDVLSALPAECQPQP
jgi:HEPN domain-containing protein